MIQTSSLQSVVGADQRLEPFKKCYKVVPRLWRISIEIIGQQIVSKDGKCFGRGVCPPLKGRVSSNLMNIAKKQHKSKREIVESMQSASFDNDPYGKIAALCNFIEQVSSEITIAQRDECMEKIQELVREQVLHEKNENGDYYSDLCTRYSSAFMSQYLQKSLIDQKLSDKKYLGLNRSMKQSLEGKKTKCDLTIEQKNLFITLIKEYWKMEKGIDLAEKQFLSKVQQFNDTEIAQIRYITKQGVNECRSNPSITNHLKEIIFSAESYAFFSSRQKRWLRRLRNVVNHQPTKLHDRFQRLKYLRNQMPDSQQADYLLHLASLPIRRRKYVVRKE